MSCATNKQVLLELTVVIAVQLLFISSICFFSEVISLSWECHALRDYTDEEKQWIYERIMFTDLYFEGQHQTLLKGIFFRNYWLTPLEIIICGLLFAKGVRSKTIKLKHAVVTLICGIIAYAIYLLVSSFLIFPCTVPILLVPAEILSLMIAVGVVLKLS